MPTEHTFPARLREAIEASGCSQFELAARAGVQTAFLSRAANEKRNAKVESVELLAAAVRVDFTWLAIGTGKPELKHKYQHLPEKYDPEAALTAARAIAARGTHPERQVWRALKVTVDRVHADNIGTLNGAEWLGALEDTLERPIPNQSGKTPDAPTPEMLKYAASAPNKFSGAMIARNNGVPMAGIMAVLKDSGLADDTMKPDGFAAHMAARSPRGAAKKRGA